MEFLRQKDAAKAMIPLLRQQYRLFRLTNSNLSRTGAKRNGGIDCALNCVASLFSPLYAGQYTRSGLSAEPAYR